MPTSNDTRTDDGAATAVGTVAGALALAGAAIPIGAGPDDPVAVALLALAGVVTAAFLARRHGLLSRRVGAWIAAICGLALALVATYGLNRGVTDPVPIGPLEAIPALLLAVVAGGCVVAAAAADYAALSDRALSRRAIATLGASAIGAVGFLAIQLWYLPLEIAAIAALGVSILDLSVPNQTIVSQVATVLGVGTVAAGYLLATDRDLSFVDLRVPRLTDLAYVVGGFLLILVASSGMSALFQATGVEQAGHSTFDQAADAPAVLLIMIPASILVVGPFEELLYRNVIQKSLYEHFSRYGAVVVASVPFALVHFSAYWGGQIGASLVSLGVVLALSLVLGALYARTENLLVPAFAHGLYNAAVYLVTYVELVA